MPEHLLFYLCKPYHICNVIYIVSASLTWQGAIATGLASLVKYQEHDPMWQAH